MRMFVDRERLGKSERQAGRNTFISAHGIDDVARIKQVLRRSQLMVRVNPLNPGTAAEVDAVVAGGADLIMLPMFTRAAELAMARATLLDGAGKALRPCILWNDTRSFKEAAALDADELDDAARQAVAGVMRGGRNDGRIDEDR